MREEVGAVVVVVPWGGTPVASVAGMVAPEGGGQGGHHRVQTQRLVVPCTALDSTLAQTAEYSGLSIKDIQKASPFITVLCILAYKRTIH